MDSNKFWVDSSARSSHKIIVSFFLMKSHNNFTVLELARMKQLRFIWLAFNSVFTFICTNESSFNYRRLKRKKIFIIQQGTQAFLHVSYEEWFKSLEIHCFIFNKNFPILSILVILIWTFIYVLLSRWSSAADVFSLPMNIIIISIK